MSSPDQNSLNMSDFVGNWELDRERTSIEFRTKALWVFPAKGTFRVLEGTGTVTADGGISGTLIIDAASIDTKNKKRDAHLRTADFFEVEAFPTITYEATSGRLEQSTWTAPSRFMESRGRSLSRSMSASLPTR
jgi:polyisoprenoid-binding protein YceI